MIIQQKLYYIICIIKNIINLLVQICQGKQIQSIPPQINLIGKLEEDDAATMFSIAEKQQKTIPNFYLDSLIVKE